MTESKMIESKAIEAKEKGGWRWSGVVFAVALMARLIYLTLDYPVPIQDTPDYDELAHNLLAGRGFVSEETWYGYPMRSWRAPFYPFFLAATYGTFGYSHLAVKLLQAVVGAFTVLLVFAVGRRLHPASALWAGGLAALYGPLVASANEVMSETWFIFFLVFAIWLLGRGAGGWFLFGGGMAIGLAALTRPVGLLLGAAYVAVVLWEERPALWRRILPMAGGILVVLAPWTWRNWTVHEAFVPISTHGGFIIARSNAEEPDWRRARGWGITPETFRRMPSEIERDRYWRQQGWEFIRTNPATYLRLAAERFLRFWYFMRPDYNFWFVSVLPWGIAGFYWCWRAPGYRLMSLFCAFSLAVFTFILYGSGRFRLPLEPFLLLFAAVAVQVAADYWGKRRAYGAFAAFVGFNFLLFLNSSALWGVVTGLLRAGGLK
jgi:4-amino-4-deoxy-L-arabinose transferase-like glycosyltransferase